MSFPDTSLSLLQTSLFKRSAKEEFLDTPSRVELSYKRAKAIGLLHNLTIEDIHNLTSKFWDLHADPIATFDACAGTLLTIQYNLALGTLAKVLPEREDLRKVVDDLLQYKTIGAYCLTEIRGGLDVLHMGTTATLLENGDFDLHTPTPSNAKYMPSTVPVLGIPCVAIVYARLVVQDEYRGIRPFLVPINDGYHMNNGITATLLPPRGGSTPVNHSITSFNHVTLPSSALLGRLEMPESINKDFLSHISRLSVGALALATATSQSMALCSDIAGLYNIRRTTEMHGSPIPIITFSTQQKPILTAVALSYVFRALYQKSIAQFTEANTDPILQRGIAICTKATIVLRSRACFLELTERCGAQGLFGYNQIWRAFSDLHGIAIAEGDILGLSIRVFADILLGKLKMPPSANTSSLLATYETELIEECSKLLKLKLLPTLCKEKFNKYVLPGVQYIVDAIGIYSGLGHEAFNTYIIPSCHKFVEVIGLDSKLPSASKEEVFNRHVLPSCQKVVEAIGHRMTYDAAVEAQVPQYLIDLFVASTIQRDSAWFIEDGGMSRNEIAKMEQKAIDQAMPHLKELLDGLEVRKYITAPMITEQSWDEFRDGLPHFTSTD